MDITPSQGIAKPYVLIEAGSDSELSDDDRICTPEQNIPHSSDVEDYTSHVRDKIPVWKLSHQWRPIANRPAEQHLQANSLIRHCKTSFNDLDKVTSKALRFAGNTKFSIGELESDINAEAEKMKMYTAALFSHVERRDSEISALKRDRSEAKKRAKKKIKALKQAKDPPSRVPAGKLTRRIITSSFISTKPTRDQCPVQDAPPLLGKGPVELGEENKPSEIVKCLGGALQESLTFFKQACEDERNRLSQKTSSLVRLEAAIATSEAERQSM